MKIKKFRVFSAAPILLAACAWTVPSAPAHASDSISFELGTGNRTDMARLGVQWRFERRWWQSNGTHIGGYWDWTFAHWRGDIFQGRDGHVQHINAVGVTPVFRLQRDSLRGWYAEAGIGVHHLSDRYDNNGRQLSTHFQFGDHLGVGYVFRNGLDLGFRFQHFSNGSIKSPNDGVNFGILRISYAL